jgi:ATP phosphoribosyltransferase regulatory subunit
MGLMLRQEDLPTRVFYADSILRHQDPEDISKNEFFQIGAELIGKPGMEADAEILLMLLEVFDGISAPPFYVHVGVRGLFDATFAEASDEINRRARRSVRLRDWQRLRALLLEAEVPEDRAAALVETYSFIGTLDELDALERRITTSLSAQEHAAMTELRELYALLSELEATDNIRLDFSEIGNQPYHTGMAFQVYMDGLDSAVAAGGRYDGLLSVFGLDAPSVGFSIMLRKMQDRLDLVSGPLSAPRAERADGNTFAERVRTARSMRKDGRTTIL